MRRSLPVVAQAASALALVVALASPATARAEIGPDNVMVEVLDRNGDPEDRAGAHPDRIVIGLLALEGQAQEDAKEIVIEFPPGMDGDPTAVSQCPRRGLDEWMETPDDCAPESRAGTLIEEGHFGAEGDFGQDSRPVYALEPAPGELVSFGLSTGSVTPTKISGRLRPGDHGLSISLPDLTPLPQEFGEPSATRFEFWGVPADHQEGTSIPRRPFLTMPTRCDRGPFEVTVRIRSYQHPDRWQSATASTDRPLRGCEELRFEPSVGLALSDPVVDSPTGVELAVRLPRSTDPDGRAGAQLKRVELELPEEMSFSAGAAARLGTCADTQLGIGTDAPVRCPRASEVGTVEVTAPQLGEQLRGRIYLGESRGGDRFRFFVAAGGAADFRFAGSMRPDPASGRLRAVLDDLPEVSFAEMKMSFDGGPRALLATPMRCGPATMIATLTPNSGAAPVRVADSVEIGPPAGGSCAAPPFEPSLSASASEPRAGRSTAFSATITRRPGDQLPDRFALAFPPGLSAGLGSVERCPAAVAATPGACPAASRVGSALVDVGSGPAVAELDGDVFLTGSYRRAPFGLVLAFRAQIGPFDLGTFTMRSALRIDPLTGRVSVETDPLPQSVEGVPVRIRKIGIEIDRPGFMRMPTSCVTQPLTATIRSTGGAVVRPQSGLRARGCVELPFRPAFSLALGDSSQLRRGGKPDLRISLRQPRGNANLRAMEMSLPAALALEGGGLSEICSRHQALGGRCPEGARVGSGIARTPLLKESLKGAIYLVQPRRNGDPDLWVNLGGGGFEVRVRSEMTRVDGRIETRFQGLPDIPLSTLTMRLAGGAGGILALEREICGAARPPAATVELRGHNGARRTVRHPVAVPRSCRVR
jgi:hypothetical protein